MLAPKNNDDALSPVIGTILMVMTAVMLGGIIGIYAFGMSENVQHIRMVATSVVQSGPDILVTYQGGNAQPALYSLTIIAHEGIPVYTVNSQGALATTGTPATPDVGSVMVLSGAATNGRDHVVVIGQFVDGSRQIISDVYV